MDNSENRPHHGIGVIILLIVDLVLLFLIFPIISFIVPVFGEMFADFGAQLPALTQFLLNLSDALRSFYGLMLGLPLWGLAFLIVWGYLALAKCGTRFQVFAYLWGIFLLMLLLNGIVILSLFLPVFKIGEVVSG